ncbi:MAG: hypothetical protein P4M01_12425 [Acidobacteriota bacterium]|nr:hypothetical protein [Acidobacteriota bacterium]
MRVWVLIAASLMLFLTPGTLAAQGTDDSADSSAAPAPPPSPAILFDSDVTVSQSVGHVYSYGFDMTPGWNLGVSVAPSVMYDTNPLLQYSPVSDKAMQVSGLADLTYLGRHDTYQAILTGRWSEYSRYNPLNSLDGELKQTWYHEASRRTNTTSYLKLQRYPSWGGSAFSRSAFGSLVLALTGLDALALKSKVDTAYAGQDVSHQFNRHSWLSADVSGGVSKFIPASNIELVQLLTAPASSTWNGRGHIQYMYRVNGKHVVGVGGGSSYYSITNPENNVTVNDVVAYYRVDLKGWSMGVSAGPQWIRDNRQTSMRMQFGGNVQHTTRRTSIMVSATDQYQVGMAQGNLGVWTVEASAERALSSRSFVGSFFRYTKSNSPLGTGQITEGYTDSTIAAAEGGYKLGRNLIWFANYGYCQQKGSLTSEETVYKHIFVTGISFTMNGLLR